MRWLNLVLFCAVLGIAYADPEPKKYKGESKDPGKNKNTTLTEDERKFLREVEAKFGVKANVPEEIKKNSTDDKNKEAIKNLPFPAVIAIEIVNDTNTNSKDKRTIDANLGYGYRTNNGYSYTYFGSGAGKGKYMIYPYSQEDIPAPGQHTHQNKGYFYPSPGKHSSSVSEVEIKPSQAYELVPDSEQNNAYQYKKHGNNQKTKYDSSKGWIPTPSPSAASYSAGSSQSTYQAPPISTLYTTYNGGHFSGFSKQFPTVMPNYYVDSSQLLKNPLHQSAGSSLDYTGSHGSQQEQKVIPVLVLRVPSSYIKRPAAELYADLSPQYLSTLNLQDLVNDYFKKIGFSMGPQLMAYQNSPVVLTQATPTASYEAQYYANALSQAQPTYTSAELSGIQYSAVQPTISKYPSGLTEQKQYYLTSGATLYQQPEQQQQYEYQYQYLPQSSAYPQTYYLQQQDAAPNAHATAFEHASASISDSGAYTQYAQTQQSALENPADLPVQYGAPQAQISQAYEPQADIAQYETPKALSSEYGQPKLEGVDNTAQQVTAGPEYAVSEPSTDTKQNAYKAPKETQYYTEKQPTQDTIAVYPSQPSAGQVAIQNYYYQKQNHGEPGKSLTLTENYPTSDHTIAAVLPFNYKQGGSQNSGAIQTVNYVTPVPSILKYQSQYKVMVPQTYLSNPSGEKVSYVHSLPYSALSSQYSLDGQLQADNKPGAYSAASQHTLSSGYKSYTRHYPHPKRMAKPFKPQASATSPRKQAEGTDKKKTS